MSWLFSAFRAIALFVMMVWFILPQTVFTDFLVKLTEFLLPDSLMRDAVNGNIAAYFVGYGATLITLIAYFYARYVYKTTATPAVHLTDTVALFCVLYLLDFFLSDTERYSFSLTLWIFPMFVSFYLIAQWCYKEQTIQLIQLLMLIIAQQCVYAIMFYLLDFRQFYTPSFGSRTQGTFSNPNELYPLCLVGIPICLGLAMTMPSGFRRWFWLTLGAIMLIALVFTYTRTGWIACAVLLGYITYRLPFSSASKVWRWLIIATIVALSLGVVMVRTKGKFVGNPDDRSFWGRFAIWQTALQVIADRPFLGNGLNTYPQKQREHMTPQLKRFNPMNLEPKNLFLHITAEFGLLGLAIFCLIIWRCWQLYRFALRISPPSSDAYKLTVGINAALLGIMVAGLADTPILHHTCSAASFSTAFLLGTFCCLVKQACPATGPDEIIVQRHRQYFWRWVVVGLFVFLAIAVYLLWLVIFGFRQASLFLPQIRALSKQRLQFEVVRLADVSPVVQDAVIASEDGYFYFHRGVDWLALHRALRKNIRALRIVQGGSTITMQVARYIFLSKERTLSRKVAEIVLALEIERHLSKERILELYLNTADFGMGQKEILAAAQTYFGKHPKDLTLAEAAFLICVLPKPPRSQQQVTLGFVQRCQQRVFRQLQAFSPERYPPEVIERAQKIPLRFRWGLVIKPLKGGDAR